MALDITVEKVEPAGGGPATSVVALTGELDASNFTRLRTSSASASADRAQTAASRFHVRRCRCARTAAV